VSGLRDPLARDPASLLGAAGFSEKDVAGQWELYQALEPSIVLARARQLLQAPASVTLSVQDGVLTAAGTAPVEWIRESRRLAPLVPGVSRFDAASLVDGQVRRLADELSASSVLFVRGTLAVEADAEGALTAHLYRLRQLAALAELAGGPFVIEIVGHADGDGSPQTNDSLSVSRASTVRAAIEALWLPNIRTVSRGVGSSQPASLGTTETDKRANRRVTLQLVRSR
jgi:OOP family OmpA-OmpF porin